MRKFLHMKQLVFQHLQLKSVSLAIFNSAIYIHIMHFIHNKTLNFAHINHVNQGKDYTIFNNRDYGGPFQPITWDYFKSNVTSLQLTSIPACFPPRFQVQLPPTSHIVLEECLLAGGVPLGETFSQLIEDNFPSSPGPNSLPPPLHLNLVIN